ncbi:galactokinase [Dissophora globulifera]|nr:galactokinase [Dissophora globulifera]
MSEPIPVIDDISILYSDPKLASARARWAELSAEFEKHYGRKPDFIARSPGRVNLIGEHVDYSGFGVLPMAIEDDCLIAVAVNESSSDVKFANINKKYSSLEFSPKSSQDGYVDINPELHAQESLLEKSQRKIPSAHEIATIAIRSERYVGALVGGMDQAASILSKPNAALFIEFHPVLKATPVYFPTTQPAIAFVIANTLVTSAKAETAPVRYNLRVVETRGAARVLALALGIPLPADGKFHLKQVLDAHYEKIGFSSEGKTEAEADIEKLAGMTEVVESVLGTAEIKNGVSYSKLCELSGLSEAEFKKLYIQQPIRDEIFHLYRRAKHVYTEERRAVAFRDTCEKAMRVQEMAAGGDEHKAVVESKALFKQLGELMDESQVYCHKYFDCSCDELEELTALARRAGAYGSRLSGAGWGGASVSLVSEDRVPEFISHLKKEFYAKHHPDLTEDQLERAIFASAPSSGAAMFVGHL